MTKQHSFKFGHLKLMDYFAILTCKEGVNIDFKEIIEIQSVLYPFCNGKKFGLIAVKDNSYSVNPFAVNMLFSHEFLVAGAIVGYTKAAQISAEIEQDVIETVPIKFFYEMDLAIDWIEYMVKTI